MNLVGGSVGEMDRKILVVGTFDSKEKEYRFLIEELRSYGVPLIALNVGVFGDVPSGFGEAISNESVLESVQANLNQVRQQGDRGLAMKLMAAGAARISRQLFDKGELAGIVGMGGSGGSSVISAAMRGLPIGFPKVLLSTMVASNPQEYVDCKDIVMIPSITDISGLNRISQMMIKQTSAAIAGMAKAFEPVELEAVGPKAIAISMFGNTTACVDRCRSQLESDELEVIVFHSTGTGGKTMESLVEDGFFQGCLDITTTELADEVCGGVLSAGPDRLAAAGQRGIPHLVVPGCVDMVNFGSPASIPDKYQDAGRLFYEWNPSVTLMRTNEEENAEIGAMMVKHLNQAKGPVEVILPLRGVSILDGDGELFCDREADEALYQTLRSGLSDEILITELDYNINDIEFADEVVRRFQKMINDQVSFGS